LIRRCNELFSGIPPQQRRGSSRYNGYRAHHVSLEVNAVHPESRRAVLDVRLARLFSNRGATRRAWAVCSLLITDKSLFRDAARRDLISAKIYPLRGASARLVYRGEILPSAEAGCNVAR